MFVKTLNRTRRAASVLRRLRSLSGRPAARAHQFVEPLEGRRLMAATLESGFEESVYVAGFDTPTAQAFAPDGRLFVLEKAGRVRVVTAGGALLSTPFLTVSPDTAQDRGLVGLTFDPDFDQNGYLYVYYTKTDSAGTRNRLSRFSTDSNNPNAAAPGSELILLESPMTTNIHTGGALAFGADGMLYLGVGEGGVSSTAQDLSDLRGKVLRIDVTADAFPADPLRNYTIPNDNPFVGTAGVRQEIWALGLRNPFSGVVKPGTNEFYVNDVGQEAWEEINVVTRGANYGWPGAEGAANTAGLTDPVYAYSHDGFPSAAITGGAFYTGNQFPVGYQNSYFFADYLNGFMSRLDVPGGHAEHDFGTSVPGPLDIDLGPDGSLYYLSAYGNGFAGTNRPVYKISYVGAANRAPTAAASADATSGLAPLTVSFSGAGSSDPDGDGLTYAWDFGDGATGSGQTVSHTYAANGTYSAVLTVSDGRGGTAAAQPVTVTVGNRAPVASITTPAAGTTYTAGQTINYSATASDPEDGTLPAGAYSWTILLLHKTHTHLFQGPVEGVKSGSFVAPTTGETDADQGYRIVLTVRDSAGLTHTTSRDIRPVAAAVQLQTVPAGLTVHLDGQPYIAPASSSSVVGMQRALSAPATQMFVGRTYEFVGWSDGGAAAHTITVPAGGAFYTATYREVAQSPFNAAPIAVPGVIEAEQYDLGGEGLAYHDLTTANEGGAFRTGEAVDLEPAGDTGGGYNLAYLLPGEWVEYTVNVAAAGTYNLEARVASLGAGGAFHVEVDGADATGAMTVPNTGGWQAYTTLAKNGITLPAGRHVLRVHADTAGSGGFTANVNWLKLTAVATNAAPAVSAGPDRAVTLPGAASLDGTLTDDGQPVGGALTATWSQVSGPGTATFAGATATDTTATFSAAGTYVLRLTGNDGSLSTSDDVTVTVSAASTSTTATLNPGADAYVLDGSSASQNFGGATQLLVKRSSSAGYNREGVLKFDLSAVQGTVGSVKLRLFGNLQDTRATNLATDVYGTSTSWSETAVTWNNRPAATTAKLGTVTVKNTTGQWYEVDLTAFVQSERAAGRNVVAFLLKNPTSTSPYTAFASREASANKPQLVVTSTSGGTPTNAAPAVNAGPDQTVTLPNTVNLDGTATDDGHPAGSALTTTWSKVSGPGTVTFANAAAIDTTATFSAAGTYVLRLTGSDGSLSAGDDVTVTANPQPAPATQAVTALVLINADTGQPIPGFAPLTTGSVLNLATLPTRRLSVRADTSPSLVGSVKFGLDGNTSYQNENSAPYSLTGNTPGGGYNPWTPSVGQHALTATPYTLKNGGGTAGTSMAVFFEVIDEPATDTQTPYLGTPFALPGTVQVEDFDLGGEGIAYDDLTGPNEGGAYRTMDAVDVEMTADTGGGYNVGHIRAGEWMEYTVNVPAAGRYTLGVRVASGSGGGTFHVDFGGANKTGTMSLPNTGGWQSWQTLSTSVTLDAGVQVMRLAIDSSAGGGDVGNINWVRLTTAAQNSAWPTTWQAAAPAPIARFEATGHAFGDKVYLFGGFINSSFQVTRRVDVYNPATNTWTRKADMPAGLAETHLGIADDGRYMYFAGGFAGNLNTSADPTQTASATVWRYDPTGDAWTQLTSLPSARGAGGLAYVGGKLHYIGGNPPDRVTNVGDHIVLDVAGGGTTWTTAAAHPNPKDHFSTVVLNGKIYVIGGEHGHDELHLQQADMHAYDPATDRWTALASMPLAKSHEESGTFVSDGRIVFAGGQVDNFGATSDTVEYDPITDTWLQLPPLPAVRQGATVQRIGNRIILTIGAVYTHAPEKTTWVGILS